MHNRWARYAVYAAGWSFLGLVLSLEVYFNFRAGMGGQVDNDFVDLAIPQFGRAVMWAAMAPLILRLRTGLPLTRGRWVGGVSFHLMMSVVVMAVFYVGRHVGYAVFFRGFDHFWGRLVPDFYGRNMIDIGYYWLVLGFGYGMEIYQRYKTEELKAARLETRLMETELKTLREQLHPHFLFNTLNTISVLVRDGRSAEATNLIARLSSLLRATLDAARTPEVPLRQELEFLLGYLEIQKARFSDRLTVHVNVAAPALEVRVPNLLLQPIVENAILHGIGPKSGPGRVEIRGEVRGETLHLEVADDGPGLAEDGARPKEGIGLSNTRERLARIYGDAGRLALRSLAGRGVTVEIDLPCAR
ncbi:histidine kinase [Opitutus sp. ER46]|uniref:sensor histidine kinase n=1 Tax=Opitutus sp. ER46 TaxID=2161864 RepID=UPI000D301766|nr:histidine kinase [Opitutus sp. ER46]PTY00071.1 hypothetical protein DB354_01930 [Opitutus sp. ER46]